jgi:hypothetical protein
MGLYLCVFDGDEELEGLEIGSYADFNFLRDTVIAAVEEGQFGKRCPVFVTHSDSDGEWTPTQASQLLVELDLIEEKFAGAPPIEFNSEWKKGVAKAYGITPKCLLDCFFDVDGEPLIKRLKGMAQLSVQKNVPIFFQ